MYIFTSSPGVCAMSSYNTRQEIWSLGGFGVMARSLELKRLRPGWEFLKLVVEIDLLFHFAVFGRYIFHYISIIFFLWFINRILCPGRVRSEQRQRQRDRQYHCGGVSLEADLAFSH